MVDERNAIDAPAVVLTEYHVNAPLPELLFQFLAATGGLHDSGDNLPGTLFQLAVLDCFARFLHSALHRFITYRLADAGSLYRVARLFALIIRGGIDYALIGLAVHFTLDFLGAHVVSGKQSLVLPERLEAVAIASRFHGVADLVLHVPGGIVHLFQFRTFGTFLSLCRMQPVFPLQFTGDLLAAPMLEFVIKRLAVLVHPQAHDVDMVAVDVGMLVHQIRLVAIAQLLHILPCNVGKLLVGQHVFRVRVYGNMKYRLLGG